MSKVNLDLSKFKHVSSDDKTTRLKHQDGHFLVLSHKHLGKDGQDQLAALAKGGKVKSEKRSAMSPQGKDVRDGETHFAKEEAKGRAAEERHIRPNIKGLADGGKVKSEAEDESVMNHMDIDGKMSHRRADPLLHPNENNQGGIGQAIRELPGDLKQVAKDAGNDLKAMVGYDQGGKVSAPSQPQPKQYDQTEKPVSNQYHGVKSAMDNAKKEFGMKDGGRPMYAEGSPDGIPDSLRAPQDANQSDDDHIKNFARQTIIDALKPKSSPQSQPEPQEQAPPPGQMDQAPVQPQGPQVPSMQANAAAQASGAQVDPNAQEPKDPNAMVAQPQQAAAPAMDANSPLPLSDKATDINPNSPQAEQQLPTMRAPQEDLSQLPPDMAAHFNEENQRFAHDLNNGHITPLTYKNLMWDGKGTLGKISSIFGMALAGMGSGLTHQPNQLLQMMDNIIKNDVEAQDKSKTNAMNFVKLNQARLRQQVQNNLDKSQIHVNEAQKDILFKDAKLKGKILGYMNTAEANLHNQLELIKTLPPGPQRDEAVQLAGIMSSGMQGQYGNLLEKAKATSSWYGQQMNDAGGEAGDDSFQRQQNGLRMSGDPNLVARADDLRSRHVPQATGMIGQSSKPIIPETQKAIDSGAGFEKQLHDFIEFTKHHSGDLNPIDKKYGMSLAAELQGAYRKATDGGVYKEGEQNFIGKLINEDPTVFFNKIRVLPSLKALQDTHHAKMNQLARNNGFKAYDASKVIGSAPVAASSDLKPGQELRMSHGKPAIFQDKKFLRYK